MKNESITKISFKKSRMLTTKSSRAVDYAKSTKNINLAHMVPFSIFWIDRLICSNFQFFSFLENGIFSPRRARTGWLLYNKSLHLCNRLSIICFAFERYFFYLHLRCICIWDVFVFEMFLYLRFISVLDVFAFEIHFYLRCIWIWEIFEFEMYLYLRCLCI